MLSSCPCPGLQSLWVNTSEINNHIWARYFVDEHQNCNVQLNIEYTFIYKNSIPGQVNFP